MVAGGIVGDVGDIALSQADARFAAGQPGTMGGGTIEVDNGTKFKSLPAPVRVATSIPVFLMNATTGGQEIIELIYNFMSPKLLLISITHMAFMVIIEGYLLEIDLDLEILHQII